MTSTEHVATPILFQTPAKPVPQQKRKNQLAASVGFQMDTLGHRDSFHEYDFHDDVFAPEDVVMRSSRAAEHVSGGHYYCVVL